MGRRLLPPSHYGRWAQPSPLSPSASFFVSVSFIPKWKITENRGIEINFDLKIGGIFFANICIFYFLSFLTWGFFLCFSMKMRREKCRLMGLWVLVVWREKEVEERGRGQCSPAVVWNYQNKAFLTLSKPQSSWIQTTIQHWQITAFDFVDPSAGGMYHLYYPFVCLLREASGRKLVAECIDSNRLKSCVFAGTVVFADCSLRWRCREIETKRGGERD